MSSVPVTQTQTLSAREYLVRRISDTVIDLLTNGGTITFPDGQTHTFITRAKLALDKFRPLEMVDSAECPAVIVYSPFGSPDTNTAADDSLYLSTLRMEAIGYLASPSTGDSLLEDARGEAHQLVADLIAALEYAPYWTGTEPWQTDDLRARIGHVGIECNQVNPPASSSFDTTDVAVQVNASYSYNFRKHAA